VAGDLHTHSSCSDGTVSPEQIPVLAAAAGLDLVALTDHDTVAGIPAALDAADRVGIDLLPGAELSCLTADGVRIHVLGYGFDRADAALAARMAEVRDDRIPRAERMIAALAADGLPITMAEAVGAADGAVLGRPHLAAVLVANGAAENIADAFTRYLHDGSRYYVGHLALPATEAIALVAAAGGVTVLAHARARRGPLISEAEIADLAAAGLTGLEVDHVDHDPADAAVLRSLAGSLDLLVTGGSDFHGERKEGLAIGARSTPDEVLVELRRRLRR
jgi:hypothetical protein